MSFAENGQYSGRILTINVDIKQWLSYSASMADIKYNLKCLCVLSMTETL